MQAHPVVWHPALSHEGEAKLTWTALAIALLVHVGILMVHFPDFQRPAPVPGEHNYLVVRKYIPPPPPQAERRTTVVKKLTRKMPLPDPTPDEPEPIREPEPEFVEEPMPADVEILIGVPEPPPQAEPGPQLAGVGGITNPVRIEESYVQPQYPELARIARIQGNVILQAVIHREGGVGEIAVLRSTHPGVGFEDAATEAVSQWRYEPATQNGRPVEVYFTIIVEFILQ